MENLNEALAQLINTALAGVDTSVDFLQAQLPDVIVQLLMWHGIKSGVFCLFGVMLLLAVAWVDRWLIKNIESIEKNDLEIPAVFGGISITAFGGAMASSFINLTWLQIWIAPKVWLIEYAAELVK